MRCPRCEAENPGTSRFCADCGTRLTPVDPGAKASPTRTLPPLVDLETGTIFAERYRIIEKLGAGGMGHVYKVYDTKVREKVALKIISPDVASDERTIERFRHELRAARQISHPNVCRMFDLGETGGRAFITMEYVPGESLKAVIRMTGALGTRTVVSYGRQIALGLEEAHRHGIIHRDLKPQNILIDPAGTAKIMDFGIARSHSARDLTSEGLVIGTPEYMAPEQAEGGDVDVRTDIYALGVVLYEMATGKVPFSGHTPVSILYKQRHTAPTGPRLLNRDLPEALEVLILRCLNKEAGGRFASARDLGDALERIANELPTTDVQAERAVPRAKKNDRRRWGIRTAVAAAGLAAVLLLAWLVLTVFWPRGSPAPRPAFDRAGSPSFNDTIAILPFEGGPGAPDALLADVLTSGVRDALAEVESLRIVGPDTSGSYRETGLTKSQVAARLGVRHIMAGRLRVSGEKVSVGITLFNVFGIADLRDEREWRWKGNLSAVRDWIVRRIASNLHGNTLPKGWKPRRLPEPKDISILEDLALVTRSSGDSAEGFNAALKRLESARAKDPDYPLIYWELGNLNEGRFALDQGYLEGHNKLKESYEKLFALAPDLPQARLGLGWNAFYNQDYDDGYARFKEAYLLAPNSVEVNLSIGSFFRSIGFDKKALAFYDRALRLDPESEDAAVLGAASLWNLGRFEDGLARIEESLGAHPRSAPLLRLRLRFLLALARVAEAENGLAELKDLVLKDGVPMSESLLRLELWLSALRGEREKAERLLGKLKDAIRYEITSAQMILGRTEEALRGIKNGFETAFIEHRDHMYAYDFLMNYRIFDGLRNDPGFKSILEKAKAEQDALSSKYGGR